MQICYVDMVEIFFNTKSNKLLSFQVSSYSLLALHLCIAVLSAAYFRTAWSGDRNLLVLCNNCSPLNEPWHICPRVFQQAFPSLTTLYKWAVYCISQLCNFWICINDLHRYYKMLTLADSWLSGMSGSGQWGIVFSSSIQWDTEN